MALFNIFKVPKHQKYRYIPRYWDPDKEDLEERVRQATEKTTSGPEDMKARISRGFQRRASYRGNAARQANRRSNMMLFIIIIALVFLAFIVLTRNFPLLEKLLQ